MRIALVSPYSWSHPGGVTRHIEALAAELTAAGHEPRVIAPFDGEPGSAPDHLVSLGPTLGWSFNGAKSNIANTLGRPGHKSPVRQLTDRAFVIRGLN